MSAIRLAQLLTYLGTLPFLYGALVSLGLAPWLAILPFSVTDALLGYGVVILSFIAGIHWGLALNQQSSSSSQALAFRLLAMSNVIALWAWLMWLWPTTGFSFWGLAIGFGVMLSLDWYWLALQKSTPWFWRLRWQASAIAMLSLGLAGVYTA